MHFAYVIMWPFLLLDSESQEGKDGVGFFTLIHQAFRVVPVSKQDPKKNKHFLNLYLNRA